MAEGCFQHRRQYNGKKLGKGYFLLGFRRDVREFFGAISWFVRPSLPWCFGVAEGCFQHRIQYNGKRLGKCFFCTASEGTLESFLVRFRGLSALHCHSVSPSFTAMVFWCGGGLFSAPESVQREKVWKRLLFDFVACPSITAMAILVMAEGCFQHRRQYNGKRLAKLAKGDFS